MEKKDKKIFSVKQAQKQVLRFKNEFKKDFKKLLNKNSSLSCPETFGKKKDILKKLTDEWRQIYSADTLKRDKLSLLVQEETHTHTKTDTISSVY